MTVDSLYARMRLPVIVAPMFLVSGPDLVVAACRSGVIGSFPGPNARTIDDLRQWFEAISSRLAAARQQGEQPADWAFNIITHSTYGRFEQEVALIEEFQPAIVISALGGPQRITAPVHAYGGLVFADVNSPDYARKAIDRGADGLVLVTVGAGGHTGEYATFAFIDEVRRFWSGPLCVGGAISTGTAIRAIELLGGDFAYMGTRFIATPESEAAQGHKEMMIDATLRDIVASRALTGALGNWMKPSVERAGLSLADLQVEAKIDFSGDMQAVKAWKSVWSAGHGVGAVTRLAPVSEIVDQLHAEYQAAAAREATLRRFVQHDHRETAA